MKLKLTALLLISSFFVVSCGDSKAKKMCMDGYNKGETAIKKANGGKIPADQAKMLKTQKTACDKL